MVPSLGLTIVGLVFIIITAIISLTKKKYKTIESYIYRCILFVTFILLVLELICVFTMANRVSIPVVNELMCRLYIFGCIIWFILLVGYINSLGDKTKYLNLLDFFKQKYLIFWLYLGGISFAVSCFLDMEYTSGNGLFYVIGGNAVYSLYVIFAFVAVYMIYLLFRKKNSSSLFKKLPVILFFVFFIIAGLIQLLTKTDFNDLSYTFVVCVIFMYFTLENQDLKKIKELEKSKQKALVADEEKTAFLSSMSHEIRTPMNTIMGFTESIINTDDMNRDKVKEDIASVNASAHNLLEIINNILDISRLDSGKDKLDEQDYSIKDIVYEIVSITEAKIDKNKVKFNVDVDENIPSVINGDKLKLNRVISNLVSNAIKYTENGDINLIINGDIKEDFVNLEIKVKDTGIGIKSEDYDKLFEKFSKLNDKGETEIRGTGLGLVIIKKLIEIMDGDVTLESSFGLGTTFTVRLKQKVVDNTPIGNISLTRDDDQLVDCSNLNVLIVDDNDLNLKVATRLFNKYKFKTIDTCSNGKECLKLIKDKEYEFIFIDHMMPEMDGIETYKRIRKLNKNIKVVIMTANTVSEDQKKYRELGFDGYIAKPVEAKLLNRLLKSIINK